MGLDTLLSGSKVLETVASPVNGELVVVKDLAWGVHITGDGLTQSGGVAEAVWRTSLKKVKSKKGKMRNCLILGLGGGSIAKLTRKFWPSAKITGVDVDPVIVELGRKYMKLDEHKVEIVIDDAKDFIESNIKNLKSNSDLVYIDTYCGDSFPEKLEQEVFLRKIRALLAPDGVAVFNRLYYGEKRPQAVRFREKLEKIFDSVEIVYPEANIMFLCS